MYLLDTNTCIRYLNGRAPAIRLRLHQHNPRDIAVCSVVKAELFYGSPRSNNPIQSLAVQRRFVDSFLSLPFDDRAALEYGRIRAELAQKGTPIGANDMLIAAHALAVNATLVSADTEFLRVPGLQVENWLASQEHQRKS